MNEEKTRENINSGGEQAQDSSNLEEDEAEKQQENSKVPKQLIPWTYKKGQSGNPEGRPKGKTLKEYCRDFLMCQTEEERQEFLSGINKETIWKMAEGNPKQDTELSGNKDNPILIEVSQSKADEVIKQYLNGDSENTTKQG